MKLYTYVLRYDGGAAPNPYWGTCTLVVCKSAIRRSAEIGDWIVGLGSANSPIGDISGSVVYAMKITGKLTMMEYDALCRDLLPKKIPNWKSPDYRLKMGDCIYDYGDGSYPRTREGVHGVRERNRDLSGKYALLSKHFYYFGDHPVRLPENLHQIIHTTQGHKSIQNQPYVQIFVDWLESLGYKRNGLYGIPQNQSKQLSDSDIECTPPTCLPQKQEVKRGLKARC